MNFKYLYTRLRENIHLANFLNPIIVPMLTSLKPYFCLLFIFCLLSFQKSSPGGLKFTGSNKPINERASYDVFNSKTIAFKKTLDIEFDLSLYSDILLGYIIRIKNKESKTVYNLFFDGQGDNIIFKLNEEGKNSLITAVMNKEDLLDMDWFKMKVSLNLNTDSIHLTIHNKTFSIGKTGLPDTYYPIIFFGKSDHLIDVPSFAIKDLSVGDKEKYFFPLRETKGTIVHDIKDKATGVVSNPKWLINDAYNWKLNASFESETVAGANYNSEKDEIYYFNNDSIVIYNVRTGDIKTNIFEKECPVKLVLGTNFIDTKENKLYSYEVYYDNLYDGPTVASLDLNTYSWTTESHEKLPIQLHHHGSYLDTTKGVYTIFGGFGNMHYNKKFYSYYINKKAWHTLEGFQGNVIFPRYFSSVGYQENMNTAYIFGGMGNESGEQIVGRKYFYDLYKIDLNTKYIKKLWKMSWDRENVVPGRGMVLDDSCFYTLWYPEHFTDSYLKLYRFSLADGTYRILGDSIPIHSDRITTNANLYYDRGYLYAVVQEFDDDVASNLKIYSLLYPPITIQQLTTPSKNKGQLIAIFLLFLSTTVGGVIYFLLKKYRINHVVNAARKHEYKDSTIDDTKMRVKPNSIYLFGDFTVHDKNNRDITYMFSTKLKQTLCMILQHSTQGGITSQRLSIILWPDKPLNKMKNSRGVTINHLRKVLEELDGIELIYDQGVFKIIQHKPFYCDYSRFIEIITTEKVDGKADKRKDELIEIITRGKFLKYEDHPFYDSFKDATEKTIEPVLLHEIELSFENEKYPITLELTKAFFYIDPINETALNFQIKAMQKLKMYEEAKIRYLEFLIEYKKLIGKDFPHPFKV